MKRGMHPGPGYGPKALAFGSWLSSWEAMQLLGDAKRSLIEEGSRREG